MDDLVSIAISGLVLAAIYAVAASGIVVTYTTTGIFNFAHGAIGMMGAFAYWQLRVGWKWPVIPAVIVVLVVVGPAMGVLIDRVIMRGLEGVSEVTKVVVSIGLLFGLISLAPIIWNPRRAYTVEPFFGANRILVLEGSISYHQITAIVVAILVAVGLRAFLFGTRNGVAMRAVVDNRSLARLSGARPERVSSMSWALGCSLATLSGILVAEKLGLEVLVLTFLVVNAYAAAVVGRLTSLPLTFLGALILGMLQAGAQTLLKTEPSWVPEGYVLFTPLRDAIPVLLLFITLLVLPSAPLRTHGLQRIRESVPRPTWRMSLIGFAVLVAVVSILSGFIGDGDMLGWSRGLAIAIIMLSLVPLTGYGGQISLAQMSFAGIGAFAYARFGGETGSPIGLIAAVLFAAFAGALVALPALRLRGIYLALATLAFSYFVEKVVFIQQPIVGAGGSRPVARPSLGPLSLDSPRSYMIFLSIMFCVVGAIVILVRLGPFGRRLQAMKDSPAACATLGLNLTVTKLQVFVLSAAIAGFGGAMLAGVQSQATVNDFAALQNLPVLLMAVGGGIAAVSGALFGGLVFASFSIITKHVPTFEIFGVPSEQFVGNLLLLAPALIGISLGRNPNGAVNDISTRVRGLMEKRRQPGAARTRAPSSLSIGTTLDVEAIGIDVPFTGDDLQSIDAALGLDEDATSVPRRGALAAMSGSR